MDLSKLSDKELEELAKTGEASGDVAAKVAGMSDAELEAIVNDGSSGGAPAAPAESSILDDLGKFATVAKAAIAAPAAKVLDVVTAPLVELDKVTGAPIRAGAGAIQAGEDTADVGKAVVDQFMAGLPQVGGGGVTPGALLPTTPSGQDIAERGIAAAGIEMPYAKVMGPLAGAVVDVGLDPTMLIPHGAVRKTAQGVADVAGAGLRTAARAAGKVEGGAARAVAGVGEIMTAGHLDADRALKAYRELTSRELLMPGNLNRGPMARQGELVGRIRQAFQERKITVPGSHDVAMEVKALLENTRGRLIASKASNAQQVLDLIDAKAFEPVQVVVPAHVQHVPDALGAMVEVTVPQSVRTELRPRDLTLDEIDDIVGNFDFLTYTDKGFDRSLNRIWKPAIKKSRAIMDEVLQSIPEGQLFKQEKSRFESLAIAGKERGQLFEWLGKAGKAGAILSLEPASLVLSAMQPSTYMQMLGALRTPRTVMEPIVAALTSGRPAMVRVQLETLAAKHPKDVERLIRAAALVSGKPEGRQHLTADEAGALSMRRVFDPAQVAAERARLQSDPELDSVSKAKALSDLNERGYILVDLPAPREPEPDAPTVDKVFGGQEGLNRLMQALEDRG